MNGPIASGARSAGLARGTTPLAVYEQTFVAFSVRQRHDAMAVHSVIAPFAVVTRSVPEDHGAAAGARVLDNVPFIALSRQPDHHAAAVRDVVAPLAFIAGAVVEDGRAASFAVTIH